MTVSLTDSFLRKKGYIRVLITYLWGASWDTLNSSTWHLAAPGRKISLERRVCSLEYFPSCESLWPSWWLCFDRYSGCRYHSGESLYGFSGFFMGTNRNIFVAWFGRRREQNLQILASVHLVLGVTLTLCKEFSLGEGIDSLLKNLVQHVGVREVLPFAENRNSSACFRIRDQLPSWKDYELQDMPTCSCITFVPLVFCSQELKTFGPTLCAAYAGCLLTRECNRLAFKIHQRSMTTTDMLLMIPQAFQSLFEDEKKLR